MIKHTLQDDQIHISIANMDFSYRVPVKKIGKTMSWKVGEKETEGIVLKNVSKWTLQLFTKNVTEDKYVEAFKSIVQEQASENSIDWKETLLAVHIQNEYNSRVKANETAKQKISTDEILSILEKKYNLG